MTRIEMQQTMGKNSGDRRKHDNQEAEGGGRR